MRNQFAAVLAVAVVALAGCSDGKPAADPPPSEVTAAPATPEPTTAGSASPSASTAVPVARCLSGRYHLARFVGLGESKTYGTGEGGDVLFTFGKGSYVMSGAGKDPIRLTLAAQQAELAVDGAARGTFTTSDGKGDFTAGKTTGSATLRSGAQQQKLTMAQVSQVLAPDGAAVLNCTSTTLQLVFDSSRLDLER